MTPDKTPTEALSQLRHLYANLTNGEVRDTASAKRIAEGLLSPAIAALEKWGSPVVEGEPVGWIWQHEETGRTGFIDCWQVENGWQENNPRLRLVSKLYATPQPTQAQAGAVPLNHKNIEPVRRFLADRGIYLSDETTKALITVAHGINAKEAGNAE